MLREKIKEGLNRNKQEKLTITVSSVLSKRLSEYAAFFAEAEGEAVTKDLIISTAVEEFLSKDKDFQKWLKTSA